MGDNVDSDLLYEDFQDNDKRDFDNVNMLRPSDSRVFLEDLYSLHLTANFIESGGLYQSRSSQSQIINNSSFNP